MVCILMLSIGEYFIPYTYLSHDGDYMDIITILVIMYVLHLVITWFLWILNINRTSLNHVCTGSEITSVRYQVTTRPPLAFYICFPWCILYPPHGFV